MLTDKDIKKIVLERTPLDTIKEMYKFGDFVEITGRAGGDVLTYRIYSNGQVVER